MSLERSKKLKKLAEAMSEAGIGKGVAGATTKTESKSSKVQALKTKADEVKKSAGQAMDEAESRWKKDTGREYTPQERKDAWQEVQTAKRYEKVGVSPIYGSNTTPNGFNRKSKELDEKYGSRLTEDDKVSSTSKKRARRQY